MSDHPQLPETVDPADLVAIRETRAQAAIAALQAELSTARVYVRYRLSTEDTFDLQTGVITRAKRQLLPPETF